ncbi:hypothetical protein AURANDRAFT_68189 [Aureococcus anophagefferens]|uniref:Uncharacterized protein n=1 Tax=Aureococcus anophagefferens TaxID=44056 RepID=F0YNS8_AURAN|nr:hypothetical protein AURANDRAFT_68189 [Aureococcus anophagefferens]EGB03239.1 hypothetical protein AURANDRAFT_68189 [Aureococcus anophagefferens]|eukprot:XP_009042064.1 hypothetical protein AURANDRAFT_68189 [Aureococcus anophagefferens]
MDKISASVFDSIFKGEALAAKCKTIPRIVLFHEGVKFRPQFIIDACQSSCQLFRLGSLCTVDFFAVKIYLLLALFALRVMLFFTPRKTLDSMFGVPSHFLTETVVYCTRPQFVLGNGYLTCPTRDAQYIGPLFESPPALDGEMKTWLENVKAPIVFVSLNSICHENSHLPAVLQALAQSEYISLVEVTDQEYWCRQGYDSIRFVSSKDRHHKYAYLPFASVFITQGDSGSFHASVLASVPLIVLPLYGDQFHWGAVVETHGLGISLLLSPNRVDEGWSILPSIARVLGSKSIEDNLKEHSELLGAGRGLASFPQFARSLLEGDNH